MHYIGSEHGPKLPFLQLELCPREGLGVLQVVQQLRLVFLVGTDKLCMSYSGFTTAEHGLASHVFGFMLQTSPPTCNKLGVKMLMYQEVSEGYFLKTSSPFPDFSCRPFLKKLGFHFLETLKCCRAKQKNPQTYKNNETRDGGMFYSTSNHEQIV